MFLPIDVFKGKKQGLQQILALAAHNFLLQTAETQLHQRVVHIHRRKSGLESRLL